MLKEQSNEHFREAVAMAIREVVEFPLGVFVTVVDAKIGANQHDATVMLSVLPAGRSDDALTALNRFRRDIKDELAKNLRLRQIPYLHWRFDAASEYLEKIDETIAELKKKGDL